MIVTPAARLPQLPVKFKAGIEVLAVRPQPDLGSSVGSCHYSITNSTVHTETRPAEQASEVTGIAVPFSRAISPSNSGSAFLH